MVRYWISLAFRHPSLGQVLNRCTDVRGGGGMTEMRWTGVEFPLILDEWFNCWCITVLKEIEDLNDPNRSSHILLQVVGFFCWLSVHVEYIYTYSKREFV